MSRFRRRLMGLAQLRESKRKDFVRVEYIENTSTAYIDTGIIANQNTNYEIKVQFTKSTGYPYIFGAQQADRDRRFSLMEGSWNAFYYGANLHTQEINLSLTTEQQTSNLVVKKDGLNMYVDGEQKGTFSNTTFTTPSTLTIFTCHYANGQVHNNVYKGRLYYFKIYDGTTLIRDYIPMYQISTDTYGLWDRVEKKFYTSPNGVKFTGGARVVEDANGNLYYIKNYISFAGGGKSLVSIGLKPNETDYYETKWYFAGSSRSNFMGARTKSNNNDYQCYGYSKALHITYDTGNIVNYSVTYTNKAYIFKTYFNKKTNQMYGAIYDANKKLLAHNKVAKRGGTATYEFFIGKQAGLNNYYPPVNSRMYYFKYWRNHNLVRDMIPVQSVETSEYGFFDKVNLKIYYSSGSADFTGA